MPSGLRNLQAVPPPVEFSKDCGVVPLRRGTLRSVHGGDYYCQPSTALTEKHLLSLLGPRPEWRLQGAQMCDKSAHEASVLEAG
mmetsp:Transcript_16656/g.45088  ORF Transcript_16656/g.45088 Transcript_16656/m.45088 type:complete len:84 (+) Transcript_16656:3356-3607(+)